MSDVAANPHPTKGISFWRSFSSKCSDIFLNKYFFLALFCAACLITSFEKEVIGALIFVAVICVALVLCDDILATTLPFFLLCVFITKCYDSYDTFIKYAFMAIPAVSSIIFHFIFYRKKFVLGNTFLGLVAVSISLLLGGVGFISPSDYFGGSSLYHTIFLGVGMTVAYLLLKPHLCMARKYDVKEKFITMLYIMGMFACFVIIIFVLKNIDSIIYDKKISYMQASNNLSTILMFALPCPFFFVSKNCANLLAPFFMMGCMVLSGSRGGILMGAVELIICLAAWAYFDRKRRLYYVCSAIGFTGLAILGGNAVIQFSTSKVISSLITTKEPRYKLLMRAKELFPQCPIFGHGLGYTGNTDIYSPVTGALEWYHMIIPQIVAGLGIFGCICYLLQLILRTRSLAVAMREESQRYAAVTFALCYIGILLMSQVNPGLFCPLPYSLITTMFFAIIDGDTIFNKKINPKIKSDSFRASL